MNLMVTQDTDKVFIQVRPPCGRNTYVLRLVVLDCVKIISPRGSLASPYIVQRAGLQIWKLILVGYNCHRYYNINSYSNRLESCLISTSCFLV